MDPATTTAIATTAIALAVAIISWRQWVTNRARLRHELFDRRYDIYQRIAAFVGAVLQAGRVEHGADDKFLRETKQAYFVFGGDPEVKQLVQEIYEHAARLQALQAKEDGLAGSALGSNVDRQTQVKQWLQTTSMSLESRFEKYLRLDH